MNQQKLKEIIEAYKEKSDQLMKDELYKWVAVKWYKDHWDINAEDFSAMLKTSLKKSGNLLVSYNFYPKKMITFFAEQEPERVRHMFRNLYDESIDIIERMENFKAEAQALMEQFKELRGKNHYQHANSISVYLTFEYPEKYYIFKYSKYKDFAQKIEYPILPKTGSLQSVQDYFNMCEEVRKHVIQDQELVRNYRESLGSDHYEDENLHMLIDNIVFFGSYYEKDEWWPQKKEYDPGITAEEWTELLHDENVFTKDSLAIMKRLLDIGGHATCTQLSNKYGKDKNFYNKGSSTLAKKIHKITNCPLLEDNNENARWWPILYVGKYADQSTEGAYIWKLRDELREALESYDLSQIPLTDVDDPVKMIEVYTKDDFLQEVFMDEDEHDRILALLEYKKNLILQGAPGVGKTYIAKRLAYSMMEKRDDEKIQMIQFHQNYSYEDFIIGYKPDEEGFAIKTGLFYQLCLDAQKDPEQRYFLIIDEINRGNLSKIFGELLMLVEKDYRNLKLPLAYDGFSLSVPENLHIIGTMNTADRSLALIDYALRRRFAFFTMEPVFHKDRFRQFIEEMNHDIVERVIEEVKSLNRDIANDSSLGEGFCIGHSYFCQPKNNPDEWIQMVVEHEIIPMIEEYWFDDTTKTQNWASRLRGILYD